MFWKSKKSGEYKALEEIYLRYMKGFQEIMVDEFHVFVRFENHADDTALPTKEDLENISAKELVAFEKELRKTIDAIKSSARLKMGFHLKGATPPPNAIQQGLIEGWKTTAELEMEMAKRIEKFLEAFLASKQENPK